MTNNSKIIDLASRIQSLTSDEIWELSQILINSNLVVASLLREDLSTVEHNVD